jgi:cytochrome o ubiquinol oxidase subunit 3
MSSEAHAHGADHGHDSAEIKLFGFWIYLMSDLIIFAVLFATFAVMSGNYAGGPGPKQLFELPYLFFETMFLLVSSVTYGLAVVRMQNSGKPSQVFSLLLLTFVLGLGFIVMELMEFSHLIGEGNGPNRSAYLSSFFTLVATHGLHVSCGLLWMAVMMIQVLVKKLTPGVRSRVMRLSLFWHFLDIVWVGVFSFVYLVGML